MWTNMEYGGKETRTAEAGWHTIHLFQNVVLRLSTCWLLFCIISRIHVCMVLPNILRIIWIQLWRLESLQNVCTSLIWISSYVYTTGEVRNEFVPCICLFIWYILSESWVNSHLMLNATASLNEHLFIALLQTSVNVSTIRCQTRLTTSTAWSFRIRDYWSTWANQVVALILAYPRKTGSSCLRVTRDRLELSWDTAELQAHIQLQQKLPIIS